MALRIRGLIPLVIFPVIIFPVMIFPLVIFLVQITTAVRCAAAEQPPEKPRPKRVLLLGQRPDGHPKSTHEYMTGVRFIARCLQDRGHLQVIVVQADPPWNEGPELLDAADGVVLYLSEGAKWLSEDPARLAAFQRVAKRGGGLAVLHWGMGTKEAAPIENFVALFGACHGGPDRKYKVGDFLISPIPLAHPVTRGLRPLNVHDELYYQLKRSPSIPGFTPLMTTRVQDVEYPVAWGWERPDQGNSFGFSGLHFHENWRRPEYRRLILQGILWTLKEPIPEEGLTFEVDDNDLALPETTAPVDER